MHDDDLATLLAEMRAEHGASSTEDYAWADQVLDIQRGPRLAPPASGVAQT
ncbi:MAG TPA: hypothetical protein VGO86_18605 [Candidatus Dormibacteraeota bacterium]